MITTRLVYAAAFVVLTVLGSSGRGIAESNDHALDSWLESQIAIETWTAELVQTRELRSLAKPLTSRGRVTFAKPRRFRWQLGNPVRTIAIGTSEGLLIAYPRLKQLERYDFDESVDPALRQVLDLLEVGFPSSAEAFHARYELLSAEAVDDIWLFHLRPRSSAARRLLDRIILETHSRDWRLLATEFRFPDGSRMRNDFDVPIVDGAVDDELFELPAGQDWQLSEPLGY